MKVIGITGGVGSGKTAAAHILNKTTDSILLIADDIGKDLTKKGTEIFNKIVSAFGPDVVDKNNGELDRVYLAANVFSSETKKKNLESIVHPAVISYIKKIIEDNYDKKGLIILESAILFETHTDTLCDEIWYVDVSDNVRRKRLKESRGYSDEKISSILKNQNTIFAKNNSSVIINNNGDYEALKDTIKNIIKNTNYGR